MNAGGAPPEFVEAAFEAKQAHRELLMVELPLTCDVTESPSAARPAAEGDFIFRLLTFSEFDTFSKIARLGDVSDLVVRTTLLYPREPWDKNPIQRVEAGFFEEVAGMIIDSSGFENKKGMFAGLGEGRTLSNTIYGAAQMFICKAFPGVTPELIGRMTMPEMFRYLAMSEQMLSVEGKPTEFPLREFFSTRQRRQEAGYIPKDFSRLKVLTEEQAEAMKATGRLEAVAAAIADKKRDSANPEEKAVRAVEVRRRKMAEIAAKREADQRVGAESESAALARDFGLE